MPLGTYKEAISARSTDSKILEVSQDGGIVSALLCYALDEGLLKVQSLLELLTMIGDLFLL